MVAGDGGDGDVGAVVEHVYELHHGHAGEPDLFGERGLCAPGVVASL